MIKIKMIKIKFKFKLKNIIIITIQKNIGGLKINTQGRHNDKH